MDNSGLIPYLEYHLPLKPLLIDIPVQPIATNFVTSIFISVHGENKMRYVGAMTCSFPEFTETCGRFDGVVLPNYEG